MLPEAYRIGWVPFIHTEIYLDSRPFIPRTETEYWVNEVIVEALLPQKEARLQVLDLCAGSGCIGVAVLKELQEAHVDFAEIDESHHSNVLKNLRVNSIDTDRAGIFGGDLFENITGKYDFILSNPPYINPELRHRMQKSVVEHEPEKALYGGENGTEIIEKILSEIKNHLKPGGIMYLEHEPEQVEYLSKHPLYLSSKKDQYGVLRYSKFKRGGGSCL